METITIAGREFKGAGRECTLAHDVWVMKRIRACGLQEITIDIGESPDALAHRVFLKYATEPAFMELMGGLLLPIDVAPAEWTEALAKQTGDFFAGLTSVEDKQSIKEQIIATLISFLALGVSSLKTSGSFSTRSEAAPATLTEAPETSENGAVFYEAFPATTP